jgi:hypothetical protein
MATTPEPKGGKERWRWFIEADRETREANPEYYWFHSKSGAPRFFWDEIEITEEEYRANTDQGTRDILDGR